MNAQQLKNAILQEAIEGRLVPQDPHDEPASALLVRIRQEKEQLVKEGKLKKKDLEVKPISEDEIPFEIPEGWEWVRLSHIAEVKSSKRVFEMDYVTTGIPFYRSKEIGDLSRGENIHTELYITKEHYCDLKEKFGVPQKGDILLTSVGSIGNFWICDGREFYYKDGNVTQICANEYFDSRFITLFLGSQLFSVQANTSVSGTAYNALTIIKLKSLLLPLPPLAEQQRIVSKIEEVLPKVGEYGKKQVALDKLNAELPDRLKKSVLQEAIEGRLVPQDPTDEPASVLLAKIRQEKEQLVKEGKLKKKDLEVKPISEDEIPFEIPENWEWVRLRDVLSVKSGEFLNVRSLNEELNYPVYGGNGINGAYDKYNVESDTLIIGRVGFYCGSIHKTFSKAWVTDNALIVTFSKNNLYVDYLQYVLGWLNIRTTSNSTAQPVVSGKGIYPLLFPLPPLAEQHRIVEKLEQLLGEINKLKK